MEARLTETQRAWVNYYEHLHYQDVMNGCHWYWLTVNPNMTVCEPTIPWSEKILRTARLSDADYVFSVNKVIAQRLKTCIHDALDATDSTYPTNHPERAGIRTRLSIAAIPALKVTETKREPTRLYHLHGWIILQPLRRERTTDPRTDAIRVTSVSEDARMVLRRFPEPVAVLCERIKESVGDNVYIAGASDTETLLRERAVYATRHERRTHEYDGNTADIYGREQTFPLMPILIPKSYWKPRLERLSHVA